MRSLAAKYWMVRPQALTISRPRPASARSRLADGGEDFHIAIAVLGDGDGVAGDLHGALGDHHIAAVHGHALSVVQFGRVSLYADGLFTILGSAQALAAEQNALQTEQEGES